MKRAGYDGHKRKKGSKVHVAVDTLGHLLALHVTSANEQERAQVAELAAQVHEATEQSVTLAYVDQGYTGETPAEAAQQQGIELHVVKLPEAKRGFVLLPRRWVVERSGGGAFFRVGHAVPTTCQRLRAAASNAGRTALCCFRSVDARQGRAFTAKSITRSGARRASLSSWTAGQSPRSRHQPAGLR